MNDEERVASQKKTIALWYTIFLDNNGILSYGEK